MPVTEQQRHEIFKWYEEVMGPERAPIMMELLPPVGWGDLATRTDLMVLEGRLRGELSELRGQMSELRGEVRDEIGTLRGDMGQLSLSQAHALRSLLLAMVATNAATVGLVFAAVRLGGT